MPSIEFFIHPWFKTWKGFSELMFPKRYIGRLAKCNLYKRSYLESDSSRYELGFRVAMNGLGNVIGK